MSDRSQAPGASLLSTWRRLRDLPGGPWLFSKILGWTVPYSGSVSPRVHLLEPGHAIASLTERRALRQHFGSVHAVALINIAELASGLAMTTALPVGRRGIVTKIRIEYFKKARGVITAESQCEVSRLSTDGEQEFISTCRNAAGDEVARAVVTWILGPAVKK